MVERRIELDRRYQRKKKMWKLKTKLETATGADREKVLAKIKRISPWWTEGGTKPAEKSAEKSAEKPAEKTASAEAAPKKPKAPPKPKPEKKPAP